MTVTTREAIWRETCPASGSRIRQLTSAPAIHSSIYMDVPYSDASSRSILYIKSAESFGNVSVWRCDLATGAATRACEDVFRWEGITVSPDGRSFFCARRPVPERLEVLRIEISTLRVERFAFDCPVRLIGCCATSTPAGGALIMPAFLGPHRFGLVRFDLAGGAWTVCHEDGDELCNSNPLLDPAEGRWLLVQLNRGARCDEYGAPVVGCGPEGATLYLIDLETDTIRPLPEHLRCGGHSSWTGSGAELVTNISWSSDAQTRERGSLAVVRPRTGEVRLAGQGLCVVHVNASRDGRFFVADGWEDGKSDNKLYLGCLRTGRWRPLCEHGASFGAPQYTHPHPWLTPDNGWVVFTSDRTGVPHVYAASVPEAFLRDLER